MELHDIYFWENNVPYFMKEIQNRYYKVLSITLTHAYLRNLRTGHQFNILIEDLNEDYRKVERTTTQ